MKSKSSTKPIYKTEVTGAYNTLKGVYDANSAGRQASANQFGGLIESTINRFRDGDPMVDAAQGYNTDVLSGKYLTGNPQLQGMIDQTGRSVTDRVNGAIGVRGLTGGSPHSGILARQLADAETRLRYGDYDAERARMGQAVGQTGALVAAENSLLDPAFGAFDAQGQPIRDAAGYASGVGGLLGNYTKTRQKQGLGGTLMGLGGSALSGWATGGFG